MATATEEKVEVALIPLSEIISNTGQARGTGVCPNLAALGWGIFEKGEGTAKPLWELLLSQEALACELIEEHEPDLADFAQSFQAEGQLQPIGVTALKDGYDVIFGMRRSLAKAFLCARGDSTDWTIQAKVLERKGVKDKLFTSREENKARKEENPIDKALYYQRLKKEFKMNVRDIAVKERTSHQTITNYLRLLDPLLEPHHAEIISGDWPMTRALAWLEKQKNNAGDTRSSRRGGDVRYRFPSTKALNKIYEAHWRPKSISEEEWTLWTTDDVRRLMAHRLGLNFTPYEEQEPPPPKVKKGNQETNGEGESVDKSTKVPVLKIKRGTAVKLLISLGKANAATWKDETITTKLEGINNLLEPGQKAETESLNKILDKLKEGQAKGAKVELLPDK